MNAPTPCRYCHQPPQPPGVACPSAKGVTMHGCEATTGEPSAEAVRELCGVHVTGNPFGAGCICIKLRTVQHVERERAAKVCDDIAGGADDPRLLLIAAARIRAGKEER